jgi:hypothetical protein
MPEAVSCTPTHTMPEAVLPPPQAYGLKFSYDITRPVWSRVVNVMVNESGTWVPIDACKQYNVAVNDFTANGGDGHTRLAASPFILSSGPPMDQILASYITAFSPVSCSPLFHPVQRPPYESDPGQLHHSFQPGECVAAASCSATGYWAMSREWHYCSGAVII